MDRQSRGIYGIVGEGGKAWMGRNRNIVVQKSTVCGKKVGRNK
jgi:hypothetical protein